MEYKIIQNNKQGKLIEIIINNKSYRTFIVASEDEFNDAVESFYNTVTNPKDFTQINLQEKQDAETKKASGKQKLLDLGLSEEEVKALIGI